MIKRMLTFMALSICSMNVIAANCMFNESKENKTYILEEKTNSGIKFNIYLNNELKYRTRYASVSDEFNFYKKGLERIKIDDMKMYELCISPRNA